MSRQNTLLLSSWAFSLFRVGASSFQSLRSCASSIFTCFSFVYFLISSIHLCFGLPIFRWPPTDFHLPCSHCYIFFSLSLYVAQPSQSRFSHFLTYVCHTCHCSCFLCPDLLNPLYSHHPSPHSHRCSFVQVLLSLSQCPGLTSIH